MTLSERAKALQTGAKRYYSGRPCPHGHNGLRSTKSGNCIECTKARRRRIAELFRQWRAERRTRKAA